MKKFLDILKLCPLFEQIRESELKPLVRLMCGEVKPVKKNQPVFLEGERASRFGIVLSGAVQIVRDDYYGNRNIIALAESPQLFAEVFCCAGMDEIPVSVIAARESEILLLDGERLLRADGSSDPLQAKLLHNLLRIVATKNLQLNRKIEITAKKTTREKLMAYLLLQAKEHDSDSFSIPYDRQALADYLGVDRSAMSSEISRLRRDGRIECRKNHFRIL